VILMSGWFSHRPYFLCLLGMHRWKLMNGSETVRYQECLRCGLVDDSWMRPIGF
jgi:hypothetical protein